MKRQQQACEEPASQQSDPSQPNARDLAPSTACPLLALTRDRSTEPVDIIMDKFHSGRAERAQSLRFERVA